ncbi:HAD domain-containing protein [Kribbella sp. NPDC051770]|uniref:HAD domain-containing protein n=1 Tax=Kribbella sp. NPDC051770 TaxID=3155413 RepID=UPI00342C7AC6
MPARPYLLLDVDGPLNPYRAKSVPPGYAFHDIQEGEKTWKLLLNQQHGTELNALGTSYELVWATSWEHGANRLIAPLLGLPELPVIVWPEGIRSRVDQISWKSRHISEWVGERRFAWVDDEVNSFDQAYLKSQGLVLPIDASRGLAAEDFAVLRAWAE